MFRAEQDWNVPACPLTLSPCASIPQNVPYLQADPRLVERWRKELESLPGFKIRIAWQGSPTYAMDHFRSVPLAHFAALAKVRGVHLISLHKGPGTDQLDQMDFPVRRLPACVDQAAGPFMDTAAIMKCLHLVITSDAAIPHLAGALGVPIWVALPFVPDWRFLPDREDCPWYPTMRLFRQDKRGDWQGVFARLTAELVGRKPHRPAR